MPELSPTDRLLLRDKVPAKLRFPAGTTLVSMGAISRKWGVTRNHVYALVLQRYGMSRLNVSSKADRRMYRVDVDDYYLATLDRLETGVMESPDAPDPGLFGDTRQFERG